MSGKARKLNSEGRSEEKKQVRKLVKKPTRKKTKSDEAAKPPASDVNVQEAAATASEERNLRPSVTSATPDYSESLEARRYPNFLDYIKPGNQLRWMWSFLEGWFVSRTYSTLGAAMPFIIVAVGGSAFLWWLRTAPKDAVVKQYETAIDQATAEKDFEKAGLYLHGLTALRPHDHVYAFRLAVHDAEFGDENRARNILAGLTAKDGYLPARKWLVQQALQDAPLIALTQDQLEGQLLSILRKEPKNVPMNRILADLYLKQGHLNQAEDRLVQVINEVPALGTPLARIQRLLNRDQEPILRHLNMAEQHFQKMLLDNRRNHEARAARADALVELGRFDDAGQILKEGLGIADEEGKAVLYKALSAVYEGIATQRLATSNLNRSLSARLLSEALQVDATNRSALNKALSLWQSGASFPQDTFKRAITVLSEAGPEDPSAGLLLAQCHAASGDFDEAISMLRPLSEENVRLKPVMVRLHQTAGQGEEAKALTEGLLNEYFTQRDGEEFTFEDRLFRAEILHLNNQFEDSLTELESHRPKTEEQISQSERSLWSQLYCRVNLALYDRKLKESGFSEPAEAITILNHAFETKLQTASVISRLARLSYRDDEFAAPAEEALTRLLTTGTLTPVVYNLLGTMALELEKPDKAVRYLERALSLGQKNPMVMNNLAVALVRGSVKDLDRALKLANDMLEIIPENPDALSTRGEIYVAMLRWEDARADLERALQEQPNSRTVRGLLIPVYEALDELPLANEHRRFIEAIDAKKNDAAEATL